MNVKSLQASEIPLKIHKVTLALATTTGTGHTAWFHLIEKLVDFTLTHNLLIFQSS